MQKKTSMEAISMDSIIMRIQGNHFNTTISQTEVKMGLDTIKGSVLGKVNVAGKTPLEMLPEQLNLVHVDEKQMWVEIHRLCSERAVMMQLEYF
jgi:hypothetical protein